MSAAEPTPVPYAKICVLGLVLTSNNSGIWIIYTMLPFMVKYYFPHMDLKELGFRAGILGSAFSIGSLFGNFLWGIVADKYGRKPALIGGLLGTIMASLMFGFSPNFWFAVFARFAWGFLNGNIGVSKTYMAEITDDSNNAKGMGLYGVIGGFGRTVGPVIGGFLLEPAVLYPDTFKGSVFETYPFALPVTVVATQCLITVILAMLYLPETLRGSYFYTEGENEVNSAAYGPLHTSEHAADDDNRKNQAPSPPTIPSLSDASMSNQMVDTKHSSEVISEARREMQAILLDHGDAAVDYNGRQRSERSSFGRIDDNDADRGGIISQRKASGDGTKRRKKSVGFANIVMVKTIGSDSMGFGPLKRVMHDDVPVNEVRTIESDTISLSMSQSTPSPSISTFDADDLSGLEQGETSKGGGGAYTGPLEDHPELTPIKGFTLGVGGAAGKDHESPGNDDSPEATSERGDRDEASLPMLPLRQDVRAPRHKLVFSNGAEFYSSAGAARTGNDAEESEDTARGSEISRGARGYFAMVSYLLSRRQILLSTFMYGLNGFLTIMAAEIIPLWVVTNKEDGGFGFTAQMIGLCTMITGPISIVGQLVLYPRLVERQGLIGTYKFAAQVLTVSVVCMPFISLTNSWDFPLFTTSLVVLGMSFINTSQMWVLISVFSFINNSCYSYQRATVNSIGQTFAATGRLLGPYLGGVIFAWSETTGLPWPLDYSFTFYLIGLLAYFSGSLVDFFPRSIQRRKREPKKLRYAQPGLGGGLTYDELMDESREGDKDNNFELRKLSTSRATNNADEVDTASDLSQSANPIASAVPASERAWRTRPGWPDGGRPTREPTLPGGIVVDQDTNPAHATQRTDI